MIWFIFSEWVIAGLMGRWHRWYYVDEKQRHCLRCGQNQVIRRSAYDDRLGWVGVGQCEYATRFCSTLEEQEQLHIDFMEWWSR